MLALEHGNKMSLQVPGVQTKYSWQGNLYIWILRWIRKQINARMWQKVVTPMLDGVADGYNVTLLACSMQTGGGKTYAPDKTTADGLSDVCRQYKEVGVREL